MTGFAQSMIDAMARVARREIRDARMATAGWGTVTSATPLAVVLDEGSGAPMTATPAPLVAGLASGDRVWVEIAGNRAVIVGRAGGGADTGWLDHGGTFGAGWRSSTASPLQYRVISGVCYWRGVAERTSGTVATGYVVTALPSQARPAGSGAPLNFGFDTGAGTVSGGAYQDEGGSLHIWASGTLPSFRIGGSYPIG